MKFHARAVLCKLYTSPTYVNQYVRVISPRTLTVNLANDRRLPVTIDRRPEFFGLVIDRWDGARLKVGKATSTGRQGVYDCGRISIPSQSFLEAKDVRAPTQIGAALQMRTYT